MMAMGMWGKNTYLADSWNRLDFFIVVAGAFEYCLHMENLNLTAIRTIRVLRPLRAINRIPSEILHPHFLHIRYINHPRECLFLNLSIRYAHSGHAAAGHAANVGQRAAAVLLCVLHLRHCRRSAVGGHSATALRPAAARSCGRSQVSACTHE